MIILEWEYYPKQTFQLKASKDKINFLLSGNRG